MTRLKLYLLTQAGEHWIMGHESSPIGPYDTKYEAEETVLRLKKFARYEDEPGYVTIEGVKNDAS